MLLFDHLVGAGLQYQRHGEAERLRGLEIDDKLELGCLFNSLVTCTAKISRSKLQRSLLWMLLVMNHRAVGVLFLVYLFLLRRRQGPAVGFDVRVFLLLDRSIVGT